MMWWLVAAVALGGAYEDGVARLVAGDGVGARTLLEQAVAETPEHANAWWELGWAHWVVADYAAAHGAWERSATLDPARTEASWWIGAAGARAALQAVALPEPPPDQDVGPAVISIAAAGDTMLGSDLRNKPLAPDDGRGLLAAVAAPFQGADIAFLNLEGTLADGVPSTKCGASSTNCYAFRTPTRFTAALQAVGIDVVSHANNHAMDLGPDGMLATAAALDEAGIAHAGRYGDTARLTRHGLTVAVVAAHSGACCANVNDISEIQRLVAVADEDADIVVLSFHGGAEGSGARHVPRRVEVAWGEQRGDVYAMAHAAVDAGADLVLGHGPHVLRGVERYRGRIIAYSLGNFLGYRQFGTGGGHGGTSVILEVALDANGQAVSGRLHPVALDGLGVPHPDPKGAGWTSIRELNEADFPESGVQVGVDGVLAW